MDDWYSDKMQKRSEHRDDLVRDDCPEKKRALGRANKRLELIRKDLDESELDEKYSNEDVEVFSRSNSDPNEISWNIFESENISTESEMESNFGNSVPENTNQSAKSNIEHAEDLVEFFKSHRMTPSVDACGKACKADPNNESSAMFLVQQKLAYMPGSTLTTISGWLDKMPYLDRRFRLDNILGKRMERFLIESGLTFEEEMLLHSLRQLMIYPRSYGILFLSENKFLVTPGRCGNGFMRIVKANHKLKSDGTFEKPHETAARAVREQLYYTKEENTQRLTYKISGQQLKSCTYLECIFPKQRLQGLFVIRLDRPLPFCYKYFDHVWFSAPCEWIPLEATLDADAFYTAIPFIEYLKANPDLVSNKDHIASNG